MAEPGGAGALWGLARRAQGEGLTFAGAWGALRDSGLETSRDTFLVFWRGAAEAGRKVDFVQDQGPSYVMDADAIVDSPLSYSARFAYKVRVTGTDTLTGEEGAVRTVTVASDRLMAKGDILEAAGAMVDANPDNYGLDVTDAEVASAEQSAAWVQAQQAGVFDIVPPSPGVF